MGVKEPQLDFHTVPLLGQRGVLLQDVPPVILALSRSEVLLVEIFGVDSDLPISRLFLVKEFFGIDPPQDLFAGDVHVALFHLLECFLVVLAQILFAESFDGPECLAGPAALFLDLFLALVLLL